MTPLDNYAAIAVKIETAKSGYRKLTEIKNIECIFGSHIIFKLFIFTRIHDFVNNL